MKTVTLLVPSLILSSVLVSACVPLAPFLFGGAAVGGVLVASDRRTSGAQLEDEGIELRAANRFRTTFIERVHINVTSYNRQVLLTGEVPTAADKATAEQLAKQVENVKSVVNELEVLGNSTLTARSSDALVTSRVKAALVDNKELYANAFKIVTERGTVFMMGRVSQREANKATEVVRSQQGVQKVVRLLEIISEEELKRIQPAPAAPPVQTGPTPVMSGYGSTWNSQPGAK
jgi:osmotically-inducible protein OsmY